MGGGDRIAFGLASPQLAVLAAWCEADTRPAPQTLALLSIHIGPAGAKRGGWLREVLAQARNHRRPVAVAFESTMFGQRANRF